LKRNWSKKQRNRKKKKKLAVDAKVSEEPSPETRYAASIERNSTAYASSAGVKLSPKV